MLAKQLEDEEAAALQVFVALVPTIIQHMTGTVCMSQRLSKQVQPQQETHTLPVKLIEEHVGLTQLSRQV